MLRAFGSAYTANGDPPHAFYILAHLTAVALSLRFTALHDLGTLLIAMTFTIACLHYPFLIAPQHPKQGIELWG